CNGYAEEWLGYSKKELIHTDHIFDIVPYEYREKVECILNEIVEKNSSKFNEVSFIRKDGSVNIGEINGAMIDYQGKNIVQLTVKDVTERNQVENKLKETNEYLDNLIESSLDPIVTTDNKGNVTRTNKAFLKLLSHRKEEVMGKHMAEFSPIEEGTYRSTTDELVEINKEFFDNIKTFISDLVEEGKIFNWDSYLIRNDKKLIPVEENIVFFCNEKGDRTGAVGIIRDITERRKAESETKEAKEFMENIFKTSVDGIMVTNNKGSITLVNEAITKMLGYSKNELIGKRTGVFNPKGESYKKNVGKYLTLLFEEGTVTAFELAYLKKDRNLIDVEVNSALLRDNKGNITGTVSTIRDITERKQDEAQLKETKDHLDNIIESSLDGIIVSDSVGNVILVNKSFLALVGFEEEEVIGKHIMELSITDMRTYESTTGEMVEINEAFLNTSMEMSVKLFEEGKVSDWESYYLRKDGIIVPVEMKLSHLYDEVGGNIGAVGVIRDITKRRKAEKEIREARDFLENIFKTTADGIIVTDNEGSITMVNDAMEEITGYPRAELLKQHVTLLTPTDNQQYSEGENEIGKLVKEGVLKERESLLKRKDGQCIIIETNMSLLFDKTGKSIGCVGINSDITERKKMEQQLLQSEKLKSLGELSGGVAHDFNNVLAAILGRVQLLKMQIKAPLGKQEKRKSMLELKKGLEIIEKASLDGAETVRRIQEFSRRRTDDKDFTQVDINELIDNALEFTRVRWKNDAESKGIKIRIRKELSPLNFTLGSSSELREVFTNLINNAIDAMPQGGEIKINSLMNDNNIVIKIGDTGDGIPKDIKDRVFDPFFTTKGVQSTGLGLSVSYGIINRHRGTTTLDSVEGEGTTFTIKFPITKKTGEWKVKEE
ncbi:MAG: PAS domain S-box protein, partial [Thermodesulfobacteriota bacterium]